MPLNKVKPSSDMYQFLNDYPFENANRGYTWNTVKGQCPHLCEYCFMRRFKLNPRRFDNSELKTDLSKENFIFVGSSNDLFEATIPDEWIYKTLGYCNRPSNNLYLFQSKNPARFEDFLSDFPQQSVLCTTVETNRNYGVFKVSQAPSPYLRICAMDRIRKYRQIAITIEPIMDFDFEVLIGWLKFLSPNWINIGADSKGHNLPEPPWEEVEQLIETLSRDFKVVQKSNLERLKRR